MIGPLPATALAILTVAWSCPLWATEDVEPLKRTFKFQGAERIYYVLQPQDYDPKATYWPLAAVHGGGGKAHANKHAHAMREMADEMGLPAILILPEFITADKQVSRFPELGEAAFLEEVLRRTREEFKLGERILLTGYSMGGQFAHRFALAHPERVQACAPFAAGTWTTPDGTLLIEGYGPMDDPKSFLASKENAKLVPERLHDLFDARTAAVAGRPAAPGAERVPFLVMCGTLDPRLPIAREFAESLQRLRYTVETAWPATPHSSDSEEYAAEFRKYAQHAIAFFKKHTGISPTK
jgi:poly(3-hydroxybutyrate) depolymerase